MWSMPRGLHWRYQATFPDRKCSPRTWQNGSLKTRRYNSSISPHCELSSRSTIRPPLDAIEQLQTALPYDLAMPGTAFFAKFGGLYPAYVRGLAYLQAGRGREAATEFQKVLDHRGIVLADPISSLAHIQLGRAFVTSGDVAKAKNSYQDFLTLWNNADADIPVLQEARAEFAKL